MGRRRLEPPHGILGGASQVLPDHQRLSHRRGPRKQCGRTMYGGTLVR